MNDQTVVLAYSGGLDTSWCIPYLKDQGYGRIITANVDVGGLSPEEIADLSERSAILGAHEHVQVDAKELFFHEVLRFLVFGNVRKGGVYPLCVGAERSLQARETARVARELGATAIAHGCTAAGNDQVRFEVALRTVAPELEILAPIRDLALSRQQEIADLEARGLPTPPSGGEYSINSGLWGVTIGGGETLDTREPLPEAAWVRTAGAFDALTPGAIERHALTFKQGVAVAFNGDAMEPVALIERVDALAARMGIGRGIHLGETILGVKGRVAFEAPAATVLIETHRELEKLVLTGRQISMKDSCAAVYGDLVHGGHFLEPAARDIEALLLQSQSRVTGTVSFAMRPGNLFVEGVSSPHSLRDASRALYGEQVGEWSAQDAEGFSKIIGLAGVLHARAGEKGLST